MKKQQQAGSKLRLLDKAECPFCWKIRFALNAKGLDYEESLVDTDNKPPELIALNPRGTVPVLVAGEEVITNSPDIMAWLENYCPRPALTDTVQAREIESYSDSTIGPAIRDHIFMRRKQGQAPQDPAVTSRCQQAWQSCMAHLERLCTPDPWFLGNKPTVADCALSARFALAEHYGLGGIENFSRLARWYDNLWQERPFLMSKPAHITRTKESTESAGRNHCP